MSYHAYMLHVRQLEAARKERSAAAAPWEEAPLTAEQRARRQRLDRRALQVFGDRASAGLWCQCPNGAAFGRWVSPWELAVDSEDGCRLALAELARIARAMARGRSAPRLAQA